MTPRSRLLSVTLVLLIFGYGTFQIVSYKEDDNQNKVETLQRKLAWLTEINTSLRKEAEELNQEYEQMINTAEDILDFYEEEEEEEEEEEADEYEKPEIPVQKAPVPFEKWKTTWKCYRRDDLSDICDYENLCYDGNNILFLDPSIPVSESIYANPLEGVEKNVYFDEVYWEPSPYPPPKSEYVPYMSTWSDSSHNPLRVNPKTLAKETESIEILDGGVYYVPVDISPDNIWNSAMQGFNLWDSQILNDTLGDLYKLPPQDYVILKRPFMYPGWERRIYQAMVQEQTQFLLSEWFYPEGEDMNDFSFPDDYFTVDFDDIDLKNFSPPPRKNSNTQVNSKNIICSEHAVIISQKPKLFSGLKSSLKFREKLFDMVGVPFGVKGLSPNGEQVEYSGKIFIDFRGDNNGGNLVNREEIANIARHYSLEPIIVESYSNGFSFEEQIKNISQVDVYIVVHGASATNEILLFPRSSIIEVFPYGMRSPVFKYTANTLDVHYIEVVSWLKGPNECAADLYSEEYFDRCQNTSNMVHSTNECIQYSKNACVVAPVFEMEMAIISAYDYIGVNINPRVTELYSVLHNNTVNNYHLPSNFN